MLEDHALHVYILGGPDFASTGDIDLRNPPDSVLKFYGATIQDRFGIWVDGGDFDHDGKDDLGMGAHWTDYNGATNAGSLYVKFGAAKADFASTQNRPSR